MSMILKLLVLSVLVAVFLGTGEYARHRRGYSNEFSRKLVHVTHALTLIGIAYIVSLFAVVVVEVLFIVAALAARVVYRKFKELAIVQKYLGEMYGVGRVSFGEFFFPLSAIVVALLTQDTAVFAAAMLMLGFADTAAALVGRCYGKTNKYIIFGQEKSVAGSVAFVTVAMSILAWYSLEVGAGFSFHEIAFIAGGSLVLMFVENIGVYGSDNLLIPLATLAILSLG